MAGSGNRTVAERKDFDVNSYRLGLTHALDKDTALHAAVSTGFRAPTAEQLYRGQTTTNTLVQGNPDLKPEKPPVSRSASRQVQLAGWPSSLSAALFQVDREDFILDSNGQYAGSNNRRAGARSSATSAARAAAVWNWSCAPSRTASGRSMRPTPTWIPGSPATTATTRPTATPTVLLWPIPRRRSVPTPVSGRQLHGAALRQHRQEGPAHPPHQFNLRANYLPAPGWTLSGEIDAKAGSWADRNQPGKTRTHPAAPHGAVQHQALGLARRAPERLRARGKPVRQALLPHRTRCGRFNMDGRYNSQDPSIVVDPGRTWRLGLSLQF